MSRRQLYTLFLCSLVPWTIGAGLLPLLPVYASQLGAAPALVGYYLAFAYLALAIGTFAAGWLSDRLQRRKALLIVAGVAWIPVIWWMGRATAIWELALLTAALWFLGGAAIALTQILAGLFAGSDERGRVFGVLGLTAALGPLMGGLAAGPVAGCWGFPALFNVVALFAALLPLVALFVRDKTMLQARQSSAPRARNRTRLSGGLILLLGASLCSGIATFVGIMSNSLSMAELGFAVAAISITGAVGGAVGIAVRPLIGGLSDRVGRKQLIALCYLASAASLLVLAISGTLWHFWVYAALGAVAGCGAAVGSALVTDLVTPNSLGVGMSLYGATAWAGGIVGFAITGHAIQHLGMAPTLLIAALLPLLAIALLIPIRQVQAKRIVQSA